MTNEEGDVPLPRRENRTAVTIPSSDNNYQTIPQAIVVEGNREHCPFCPYAASTTLLGCKVTSPFLFRSGRPRAGSEPARNTLTHTI